MKRWLKELTVAKNGHWDTITRHWHRISPKLLISKFILFPFIVLSFFNLSSCFGFPYLRSYTPFVLTAFNNILLCFLLFTFSSLSSILFHVTFLFCFRLFSLPLSLYKSLFSFVDILLLLYFFVFFSITFYLFS